MEKFPEFVANHLFLFVLLVSILILLFWNLFGAALSGVVMVSPQGAVRLLNDHALIVDIRNETEFGQGHILGARNISAGSMNGRLEELAKYREQPVILCCNNGNESVRTGRTMKMKGFKTIYCIQGGLQSWRTANLPLTRTGNTDKKQIKEGKTNG